MHTPQDQAAVPHVPLAERWARLRAAYRLANLASHHVLGFAVKLVLLAYFLFAILFLALRYAILPNIDLYKGDIEKIASRAVGNPVSIARIYASWSGLRPNLFLGDVLLKDSAGRKVLSLGSVSATLSWWSVLAADVRFESLEVIRPELDVVRAMDGRIYVAGILLEQKKGDGKGADWALKQREIVLREGRVAWTDERRATPALALENVNLVLRNRWTRHQFALQATPPAHVAAPIDVRADFSHPRFAASAADVALWKGELYADLRDADLAVLAAYVDNPIRLVAGKGSLRAWLSLDHARLAGFTADVGLAGVTAHLGRALPPLDLVRVAGRVSAHEIIAPGQADGRPTFGSFGHALALTDFSLETSDGLTLPPTTLSETYTPAKGARPELTEVSATVLDLETLAVLAGQLPLSPAQRQLLADFAPRGRLHDFSVQWEGSYPAVSAYRFKGRVAGLGIQAQAPRAARPATARQPAQVAMPAIPGFENLTGAVDANQRGGQLVLDSRKLVLKLSSYFDDPDMPFDVFNMRARWSFEDQEQFLFKVESMEFVQGRLQGTLAGTHLMPVTRAHGKAQGTVDFTGTLSGFDLATVGRYLPLQTPPELRHWLTGALEAGTLNDATIRLRGDLSQFPFRADSAAERARGEFRVAGKLADARLNYTPGHFARDGKAPLWPQAEHINGTIVFDRARMEIKGDTARTAGVALSNVKAVVPDLMAADMMLDIDGSAAGPMQGFMDYMAASPVLGWIGNFTEHTRTTGNARLGLKLHIPLHHAIDTKVNGVLQLAGNDIVLFDDLPPIQSTLGKIEFNEHGVNLNGIGASFLGSPLALTGGSQKDDSIVIRMAGGVTAEGLRRNWPAAKLQRLMANFSGATRFAGTVLVKDKAATVTVDSTLAGLALDFPQPLRKAAADAMPAHFTLAAAPTTEGGLARDEIRLQLGGAIGALYRREKQGKEAWRILHGGIGVNVAAPEPDSGLMINASMRSLNLDQWAKLGSSVLGGAAGDGAGGGAALAQFIVPDVMAARATELIVGERKLDNVVVGASNQKGVWQASIDSTQVSGHVTWSEGAGGQGMGKVTARLASLIIPESSADDVKDLIEAGKSPTSAIPALDIVAERFELFNKQLGRLELVANNATVGQGHEWRINKLSLANKDGELKGTGRWVPHAARDNTSLNFVLDIANAGKLLDRFGFPETVRNGKGSMKGEIAWTGLPYALDIPSLSGKLQMNVESGQFLKQDPGVARLLGVLSLQALPRLLKLDFHDVFSEGLAFDGIAANAVIERGVVRTDNLKMHGVAATILMDGTADIANETTNLHVVVIPEFNLGTGPLVYGLAVNPVIGLGGFLAQLFLRAPMMKALTYHMEIKGPWRAPIVTKLDNKSLPAEQPN